MKKLFYSLIAATMFVLGANTLIAQTVLQTWDFEGSMGDWVAGGEGSSIELSTEQAASGSNSLKLVKPATGLEINLQNDVYEDLQEGDVIQVKVWISAADLADVNGFQIFWQTGAGWSWNSQWINGSDLTGDAWTTLQHTFPAIETPLQRIGFQLLLQAGNEAKTPALYVDDITISRPETSLITVDAEKDAFYNTLTGPDDGYLQIRSYSNSDNGRPQSDEDLSAEVWVAWDDTWFYLYEEVKDDILNATAANVWEEDELELKFDAEATDSVTNSIWDVRLTLDPPGAVAGDSLNNVADSLKQFARKTIDGGYALELAIKWSAIGHNSPETNESVTPAVDSLFGLAINQHDNDGNGREASLTWAAVLLDAVWNTPKYLGTVKFLNDNKLQFIPTNNMTGVTNPTPYDGSDYFRPIVIDGQKDGFYNTLTGPDDGYLQLKYYACNDNGAPYNNADLSAQMWAAWDADWFYFYTEVMDDTISGSGDNSYQSDGIEFKFDPQATSTSNSIVAPNLTILDTTDEGVTGWDNLNSIDDSLKQFAKRVTSNGYALEVALKWDAIVSGTENVSVAVDSVFGLALNVHDNDDPVAGTRVGSVMWAAVMLDAVWNTPGYLGTVKFLADNKLQFIAKNNITDSTNTVPFDGTPFYIKVDGQKDPVFNALTGPDDGYLQIRSYAYNDNGAPVNDADLSSQVWSAWDADWLYMYTEVRDDTVSGNGPNSYQSDGLELKIDPQPTDSVTNSIYAPNLTALDTLTEGVVGFDDLNSIPDSLKQWARRLTSNGYALELAIKWDAIEANSEMVSVDVDSVFGLAINFHDNDGNLDINSGRQASVMWSAVMLDAAWNTPKYLGRVIFLDDNKLLFDPTNNMTGVTNPIPYDGSDYTDVEEEKPGIPLQYSLSQNYPNPFNPSTTIRFSLPENSDVKIILYNTLGQKVTELVNGNYNAGYHKVTFNAAYLASGVYFYRIEAGSYINVKKLMLLK